MPKIVDHAERRAELLAALWQVVEQEGAGAVSVRSVAERAGVSKSSLAHYFPSQAALVAAAIEQVMDETQERLDRLDLSQPDVPTMVAALSLGVPDSPDRRRQAALWLHLVADASADSNKTLHRLNDRVARSIQDAMKGMADSGLLGAGRDVRVETQRLHALVDGLSLQAVSEPKRMTSSRVRRILTQHVEDLLTPAPDLTGSV